MSEYQNIIIIGGHNLVNSLTPILPQTHRILVVDANEFAYWPLAGLRAAVIPGWEDKLMAPITQATFFKEGTPHQVIAPNKVVELKENSIVLEKPWEGNTEIPFFKCVIATGAAQALPMRPTSSTIEGTKSDLRKMQKEVEASKKVLVIGGGPAGVEFAGEVRDTYPDKEIFLVHNRPTLLNSTPPTSAKSEIYTPPATTPKLAAALERDMKSMNIQLFLDDRADKSSIEGEWDGTFGPLGGEKRVKLKSGKEITADFVFISTGNSPGSGLVEKADPGAVADRMIWVDEYLRVKSKTPDSILTKNYYAIGDCCTTPGWKTSQGAQADGKFVGTNIVSDIKGKEPTKYSRGALHFMMVPLGASKGQGSATVPVLGTFGLPQSMVSSIKGKKLFIPDAFLAMYTGAEKVPQPTF